MKSNKLTVFAIMTIFFVAMGVGTITPAIANIAAAFPDVPFTTILLASTLPSLLIIPSTLITGAVAGKKVGYKPLALLGLALFAISGMAPAFVNSTFTIVLVFRAIFGISLGILSPLGNALVMEIFEGQKRANMLGVGSFVMNIGGIALQFLGGALSGVSWELCFVGHFPAIISFVLVLLFLKEPEKPQVSADTSGNVVKDKMSASVWVISIIFGFTMMLIYPMLMNMSSIIADVKQVGDATQSAVVLSMYTVGGAISGVLFGKVYEKLQKFIITIAFLGGAAGIALIIFGNSVFMMTAGTTITGIFYMLTMPLTIMLLGMYAPPSLGGMAVSIMMAVMNAFAFVSTYWISFVGNMTGDVFLAPLKAAIIGFIAIGVIFLFINPFPKQKAVEAK